MLLAPAAKSRPQLAPVTTDAYLDLSVEPVQVAVGEVFTLHISYHNIGLPYTYIHVTPTGRVVFTPSLPMPCRYYEEPSGCTAVPLQALDAGSVQFTANATGEVYDESCGCWLWGGGSSRQPATLIISGTRQFLPFVKNGG